MEIKTKIIGLLIGNGLYANFVSNPDYEYITNITVGEITVLLILLYISMAISSET